MDSDDLGTTPGLPDETFEHDGLITKRHQRASAFAFLRPRSGELLWDLGAGSGAVAIEWCRAAPDARAVAVERDPERAGRARHNAERLASGRVEVLVGDVPGLLGTLPRPDAVFVGGGASAEVLDRCWDALGAGGRLVVHGVTIDTEGLLVEAYRSRGGSLARLGVETAEPLGRFLGWRPLRPVVQWACVKGSSS